MANEFLALLYTAIALGCGLGLVHFCKKRLETESSALLVAVLIAPTVFYLGLSGRLVEFKGLGVEAKFQQAAAKIVIPSNVRPAEPSASAIQEISSAKALLGMGSAVVLLTAPEKDRAITPQSVFEVASQISPGLLQGTFELLVIVDQKEKVLGYFRREFFFDLLRIELDQTMRGSRKQPDSKRVGEQLEQTQLWDIVEYPKMRAESWGSRVFIDTADTNAEALRKLTSSNQDVAVVVSATGAYAGIVRRTDIIAELLGALASSDPPKSAR